MRKIIVTVGMMLCVIISGMSEYTVQAEELATGALEMTEEEREEFLKNTPEIVDVKLNEKGLALVKEALGGKSKQLDTIDPVGIGEEVVTDEDAEAAAVQSEDILPVSVDVSANNTFPPIGNQGQTLSCTAWANAYYMMTNNLANVRGWDAKHNSSYWISPKWVYHLIKEDGYSGSNSYYANRLLCEQGAPFFYDLEDPIMTNSNWQSWILGKNLWENALNNKMEKLYYISVLNEEKNDINLDKVKKILMNGYVVTFGTYIHEWKYVKLQKNGKIGKKGQNICYAVTKDREKKLGHAMTIVGYDDLIEIDINGDGITDTTGAFKVADSYGLNNMNDGYIWLAYDALKPISDIPIISNMTRQTAFWGNEVYFLQAKPSYCPLLLAEITLLTNSRQQIRLEFGISDNSKHTPEYLRRVSGLSGNLAFPRYPFDYNNGEGVNNVNFSGGDTKEEGTFVFDLTTVIKDYWKYNNQNVTNFKSNNFYVKLTDSTEDTYETSLIKVKLIDRIGKTEKEVICNQKTANGNSVTEIIDYQVLPMLVDSQKSFTASYGYPVQKQLIDKNHVYIYDQNDNLQNNLLNLSGDRKMLTINAPDTGYAKDSYYTLIHDKVLTDGGNVLENNSKFYFYVP